LGIRFLRLLQNIQFSINIQASWSVSRDFPNSWLYSQVEEPLLHYVQHENFGRGQVPLPQ
jgi:hypothetical protein